MEKDNLRDFLKSTLSSCMRLLEAKSGSIFLYDEKKQELILKIINDSTNKYLKDVRQRLGESISGLVAAKREPLLVEDISRDCRLQNRRRFNHYQTNSFISIPLLYSDKLIGVLNINDKISKEAFTVKDLEVISTISNYIAIAIYKSQLNEKLRKYNQQLNEKIGAGDEEHNKLKQFASIGKLVAGMAHELNNPLDGVIRYINLSLGCLDEDGIVREYLLNSKHGLNRIVNIIRTLLDFAQTSSPVFNRSIDINKAVDDSLLMMSHYIHSNNIKVIKQFNTHLPVVCDNGLKLVFTNIIKNTCDAMPKGGTIKVITELTNDFIEIGFSDTGPGIPKDIQNRIFEPFFTTKEMGKGAGLGLAISYDIVQRHNGKIFLEENGEKGASFKIQLPINKFNQAGGH